jgi:aminoglycoside/choline kinase family phosphotransferase
LVSDLGVKQYYDMPKTKMLYDGAINALLKLQLGTQKNVLPEFNIEKQYKVMNLYEEIYLQKHRSIFLSSEEKVELNSMFKIILDELQLQEYVFVHNDYHSRNLIVTDNNNPGIVDFQDAIYGPITNDLVSLLHDVYVNIEENDVKELLFYYWENAKKNGLIVKETFEDYYVDFEWTSLQKSIKNIGIFANLYYKNGNNNYLQYIPILVKRCIGIISKYKEFEIFKKFFV